jgi:hypothetical protein
MGNDGNDQEGMNMIYVIIPYAIYDSTQIHTYKRMYLHTYTHAHILPDVSQTDIRFVCIHIYPLKRIFILRYY